MTPLIRLRPARCAHLPRQLCTPSNQLGRTGLPPRGCPLRLAQHRCISYSYTMASEVWRFTKGSRSASVRPSGPLRVNNGDAMIPALIAGTGVGMLPDFFLREALESNKLERLLPDWSIPLGAVYWITPPERRLPKRVEVLGNFLIEKLAQQRFG
jgi:DNA-binding transcriptional LysR family regulator